MYSERLQKGESCSFGGSSCEPSEKYFTNHCWDIIARNEIYMYVYVVINFVHIYSMLENYECHNFLRYFIIEKQLLLLFL